MLKIFLLLSMIIISTGCRKILKCDEKETFKITKENYVGTELRIDGYYCSTTSFPELFYRNGVIIGGCFSDKSSNQLKVDSLLLSGEYGNYIYDNEYRWGLFVIANNEIKREYKNRKSAVSCKYTFIESGQIINDSTFVINAVYNENDDEKTEVTNDTFRLKVFSPKPDSTNKFIGN